MNKKDISDFLNKINHEVKPFDINILRFEFSFGKIDIDYNISTMLYDSFYKRKEVFENELKRAIPFCVSRYEALYYTISTMSYCFNARVILDESIINGKKLELE